MDFPQRNLVKGATGTVFPDDVTHENIYPRSLPLTEGSSCAVNGTQCENHYLALVATMVKTLWLKSKL